MRRKNSQHQLQSQAMSEFLACNAPQSQNSDVLVFIPVHNEEHTIARVVEGVRRHCDFDLLIIDDGSTDSTTDIIQQLGVRVLRHPLQLGSRVIFSGLQAGDALNYDYVIKIDGDDQHDPQDIPRLYQHAIQTESDIVIGSRHLNGFDAKILSVEGSGMLFCSKLVSLLVGKRITDTTSGFKIWSRKACQTIIQAFKDGKLKDDSTYHVEELIFAARKKLKAEEISIIVRRREFGQSKSYSTRHLILFPLNLVRSTIRACF